MEPSRVLCLTTDEDDEGTYCIKGKKYEVLYYDERFMEIEAEPSSGVSSIQVLINDHDFLVLYEEE